MDIDHIPHKDGASTGPIAPPATEPNAGTFPSSGPIRLKAALPNLVLAGIYGLARFMNIFFPGISPSWLGKMMGIEFLVIHSFPFMMLFGTGKNKLPLTASKVVFWFLFVVYFLFALKMAGPAGVLAFGTLTVTTYLGFLLRRTSPDAMVQLCVRWFASFMAFMMASAVSGVSSNSESWPQERAALFFGMVYFVLLAVLEVSGIYESAMTRWVGEHIRDSAKQ
jgi:hypothetical protein